MFGWLNGFRKYNHSAILIIQPFFLPTVMPVRQAFGVQLFREISDKKIKVARAIRKGMKTGSLDQKILAWAIALSGQAGIPSSEIALISSNLSTWPGQSIMRRNSEAALARENLSAKAIIKAFGNQKPESLAGAKLLARSYLKTGNKKAAQKPELKEKVEPVKKALKKITEKIEKIKNKPPRPSIKGRKPIKEVEEKI